MTRDHLIELPFLPVNGLYLHYSPSQLTNERVLQPLFPKALPFVILDLFHPLFGDPPLEGGNGA